MIFSLLLVLVVGVCPAQGPGEQAVVIVPVANLFSAPTEDTDVVTQAIYGTTVGLLEEQANWIQVRMPDDYVGWVHWSALRRLKPGEKPYASAGRIAQVENLFANLYRETDVTKHKPLLTLPFGARLEVVAEPEAQERRWIEVRLPDERSAWIQRGDVALDPKPRSIAATIELSKRFIGLPYLWGGTSSFGLDCSGFVQMLYRERGILIPRDAGPQAAWQGFIAVPKNKLKPGDLLFFGRSEQKITHTGMYIGRNQFINATTHDQPMVQIDNLKEPYWTKLFVAARRPK